MARWVLYRDGRIIREPDPRGMEIARHNVVEIQPVGDVELFYLKEVRKYVLEGLPYDVQTLMNNAKVAVAAANADALKGNG